MAFKGMTERFEKKMDDLYGKYSSRGPDGAGQPFLEIKPNDPSRHDTKYDTQMSPNGSFKRDQHRVTSFLKSPSGIRFLLTQAELQSANTFSETRIYNPLFPFGKLTVNGPRIQRSISNASFGGGDKGNQDIRGVIASAAGGFINGVIHGTPTGGAEKSPGADASIGDAGRLQKSSAKTATNRALGRKGPTGLINLIPPNKIIRVINAVQNTTETGILGINQRPELNVDGEYFSVALWTGFKRSQPSPNSFVSAGASLRKGDINGALSSLGSGVVNEVKTRLFGTKAPALPNAARSGRNDYKLTELNGLRYFIVNDKDADRYIQNSVQDTYNTVHNRYDSKATLEFLNRRPHTLQGDSILFNDTHRKVSRPISSKLNQQQKATTQTDSKKKSLISKVGGFLKGATTTLTTGITLPGTNIKIGPTDPITGRLKTNALTNNPFSDNAAEERLLFGEMSLANQYENAEGDVKYFKDELVDQKTTWQSDIRKLRVEPSYRLGYVGGLTPGNDIVDDGGVYASKRTKVDGGRYFSDGAVSKDPILINKDVAGIARIVNPDLKSEIRVAYRDVIDFIFHDYVNNRVIPFRAMLTNIQESTAAEYDSQRYIGRTEKNIVYGGAGRDLSFSFFIQAFSKDELKFIWQKINYLTGLCYPAGYADGFMIPPFTQLTIGRLYLDQPGNIKTLSYTIDDNVSWDIDEDSQVPMGINVSVTFAVIEKTQVRTGSSYYGFGDPRPLDAVSTSNNDFLLSPVNV